MPHLFAGEQARRQYFVYLYIEFVRFPTASRAGILMYILDQLVIAMKEWSFLVFASAHTRVQKQGVLLVTSALTKIHSGTT